MARQCMTRRARHRVRASRVREKCVDIPEGIGRSDRARHASRIVVADRVTFASVHAPAGLSEVAHGGVEERFGGLVHGRARREGSRSLE